jgi:hypothetical protein
MWPWSVEYEFYQSFSRSAREAFDWCTDYQPQDPVLMGERGDRTVRWLTKDIAILTDRFRLGSGTIVKRKLVHLYPDRLFWASTHLAGPARQSQFLYQIRPAGKRASRLHFMGLQFERRPSKPSTSALRRFAERLRREDSLAWHRLAAAMTRDLAD